MLKTEHQTRYGEDERLQTEADGRIRRQKIESKGQKTESKKADDRRQKLAIM